jgi:creatinine amidohydrolase/Fe(II)-dependent formamide hydrolase-like protein
MATGMSGDQLQKAAQATKEQARNVIRDATESARSTINEQKDSTASSLGSFAGALRKAAKESPDGGQANRMAEWAADGLERVSSTLRNKDLDGIVRDVQSFARQQPVAFFAAALAAGFLATRFLKAGAQESRPQEAMPQNFPPRGAGLRPSDVSSDIPF